MPRIKTKPQKKHEPYSKVRGKMSEKGVTQRAMAKVLGLTEPAFSQKMTGKLDFTVQESNKICEYLRCNPSVFYSDKVCSYRNSIDIA